MACTTVTLSSIDARCDGSVGGIKRILLANVDDIKTVLVDETTQKIKQITLETGKKFEQWLFRKNTGSYNSSIERDMAIGTQTVTTECSLQFSRAEAQKRLDIQSAINASCVVIIEDMYSEYLYLGLENDVTISSATMQSGTATSDLSGFQLTFTDLATELPHFIDKEQVDVDGLLVAAAGV